MSYSYSLHTQWEGVWEVQDNSWRNGDRMIITFSEKKECVLTEAKSLNSYILKSEPQNTLKAHWDQTQRYYIGTLSQAKDCNEIEWNEMKKKRKRERNTKWIRIDLDANQYLTQTKQKNKHKAKRKRNRALARTKNKAANNHNTNYQLTPITQQQSATKQLLKSPINDPAIVEIQYNNKQPKYQQEHRRLNNNQFYVDHYPKPRKTALRHEQTHEFRQKHRGNRNKQYQIKGDKRQKAAVLDAYLENSNSNLHERKKKEQKPRKDRDRRKRKRFAKHLTNDEVDKILEETKTFKTPVLYIGEISISRFNPNVAFVSVDGLNRDIRISGFVDRNRAFHGDRVVVSTYPQIEWMSAIKPEIKEFQDKLDARDRDRLEGAKNAEEEFEEEEEDDILDGYNASSSSSSASEEEERKKDIDNGEEEDEEEAEIIILDDDESTDKEEEEEAKDKAIGNGIEEEHKEEKINETKPKAVKKEAPKRERKKRGRLEDLVDVKSMTAYDRYLFLRDVESDFAKFKNKWPDLDLMDANHPRREYIDRVQEECDGLHPNEALSAFKWSDPKEHNEQIARGRIVGIYATNASDKDQVPGFLLPIVYTERGGIDRKWAQFTPSDKRYPKAMFPMRELPQSLKSLFSEFEEEEMEIIEEYENRVYELRRERMQHKIKEIKKRVNIYREELRLQCFNMQFEARWPHHSFSPICHLKCELGKRGAIEVETNIILSRHKIGWRQTFSREIEESVSKFAITESDFIGRKDCRSLRVFTIDPTSARDFDDALSIEILSDEFDADGSQLYRVGIHIADVTHFVAEGSMVDEEAARRATSVYLVDRCLPMLPHHLCQNLCSLNPNVERLSYSVFVILNKKGHLIEREHESPWFGRTVIRSRARLNYETAHWILSGKINGETPLSQLDECCSISQDTQLADIVADTRLFWSIAKQMRERRFAAGSVKFFRPRIRFRLDKNNEHQALVFGPEIMLSSNHLIEEMMLLANQLVAAQLVNKIGENALLRRHPEPLPEKVTKCELMCRSEGFQLKCATPKQLNESLQAMQLKSYGGISAAEVMNSILAESMRRAEYIVVEDTPSDEYGHWALNFPIYTHFTSPIRRYADVLVHRLLTATISSDNNKIPSISRMKSQCKVCNVRNRAAHFAQIESQFTHLCLVLINRPVVVETLVIDMLPKMFILVVPGLGIDVRVNINDVIEESCGKIISIQKENVLPDCVLIVEWKSGERETFKLFDKMRVRLTSRLKVPMKLVTKIIDPINRKNTKAANQCVIEEDKEKEEYKTNNNPVAMTLDSQLKVGTCDYYAGVYD